MSGDLCELGSACLAGEHVTYPGSTFFIDPDSMSPLQLLWAFVSYGYVLFISADMIGDGAELLLLIPAYKDLVASVVLPILGAVPDGMMVLFSGLGPLAAAQENVAVGVGALAGSTIMLLTLPWVLSFFGGKVDMVNGKLAYDKKKSERDTMTGLKVIFKSGIEFDSGARANAKIMMLTSFAYLFIQIPAYMVDDQKARSDYESEKAFLAAVVEEGGKVHMWAGIGAIACVLLLAYYLFLQVKAAQAAQVAVADEESGNQIGQTYASFLQAAPAKVMKDGWLEEKGIRMHIQYLRDRAKAEQPDAPKGVVYQAFVEKKPDLPEEMKKELTTVFTKYAKRGVTSGLGKREMQDSLSQIGLNYSQDKFDEMFKKSDVDKSNSLEVAEFLEFFKDNIVFGTESLPWEGGGDDDDEDEMPDEFNTMVQTNRGKQF
jgi:Ca2+-binding EF-hand superfamily protein